MHSLILPALKNTPTAAWGSPFGNGVQFQSEEKAFFQNNHPSQTLRLERPLVLRWSVVTSQWNVWVLAAVCGWVSSLDFGCRMKTKNELMRFRFGTVISLFRVQYTWSWLSRKRDWQKSEEDEDQDTLNASRRLAVLYSQEVPRETVVGACCLWVGAIAETIQWGSLSHPIQRESWFRSAAPNWAKGPSCEPLWTALQLKYAWFFGETLTSRIFHFGPRTFFFLLAII